MISDFLGKEIKIGSIIIYPVRQGSRMWLEKAQVYDIAPGRSFDNEDIIVAKIRKPTGYKTRIYNFSNVVVAPKGTKLRD